MRTAGRILAITALVSWANVGTALDLSLPANAVQTAARNTSPDLYAAPVGVFVDGKVEKLDIEGCLLMSILQAQMNRPDHGRFGQGQYDGFRRPARGLA